MLKVKVITGYVPIPDHPRSAEEYGKLGENLGMITAAPVKAFYNRLSECWLTRFVWEQTGEIKHSEGDNPKKNTVAYHCVNHQKFEWLWAASELDSKPDVFVWMDYGIFHVPGVTATVIDDYLKRVTDDKIAIPGCWDKVPVESAYPCWRFCGGVFAVPRAYTRELNKQIKETAKRHIWRTKNVEWEVNTMARMEKTSLLPIRWYKADHNETLFTGY